MEDFIELISICPVCMKHGDPNNDEKANASTEASWLPIQIGEEIDGSLTNVGLSLLRLWRKNTYRRPIRRFSCQSGVL